MYNEQRDDSLSWFGERTTRSLIVSWKSLLDRLGPLMHASGKVIYVNNHDKRIDVLRQTDGFFDEFTSRISAESHGPHGGPEAGARLDLRREEPPAGSGCVLPALPPPRGISDGSFPGQ